MVSRLVSRRRRRAVVATIGYVMLISLVLQIISSTVQRRVVPFATIEASSSAVYYGGNYWNDFEPVRKYMNRLASGNESLAWQEHLLHFREHVPFKKALILSCGNGWVEAELYAKGIIESAVGIDINEDLLAEARARSVTNGLPFRYYKVDSNRAETFPENGYDVVINHASLHHVAYIDRHVRLIYEILHRDAGVLVNVDYTGPNRNQYDALEWDTIVKLNEEGDPRFHHDSLGYAHLPTMLTTDPSEAIHSELIVTTLKRYLIPLWDRPLNGALAYALLTHNKKLSKYRADWRNSAKLSIRNHFERILNFDEEHAKVRPDSYLFWYSIMKCKPNAPTNNDLQSWSAEERVRENLAVKHRGVYYPPTSVHDKLYGRTRQRNRFLA